MKQSFKVFTPNFQAEIDHIVNVKHAKQPEREREQVEAEVMNILMQYWTGNFESLPKSYSASLQVPEYVEYEFDSSEIGQLLLPTMIPSSFKRDETLSDHKGQAIIAWALQYARQVGATDPDLSKLIEY